MALAQGSSLRGLKGLANCLTDGKLQMFQPCRVLWMDPELVSAPPLQGAGFEWVLHDDLELCAAALQVA